MSLVTRTDRTVQIDRRPLVDRLAVFPRLGLANLPTPLEPMKRLTAHLGGPRLWVKREDATGLGFGGNKLRKLDYVLHDAVASKADVLVSGGVVQSNSQRQVAAAGAKLGLEGLIELVRARRWQAETDVIFIHTGGAPQKQTSAVMSAKCQKRTRADAADEITTRATASTAC